MSRQLDAALRYAAMGWPVFPLGRNKRPRVKDGEGFKDATTDEATIREWWTKWPTAGIGTPTGGQYFVLDIDDADALAKLEAEHEPLPPTVEVVTPRPGRHLYFRGGVEVTNAEGTLPGGINCRGTGGYVCCRRAHTRTAPMSGAQRPTRLRWRPPRSGCSRS